MTGFKGSGHKKRPSGALLWCCVTVIGKVIGPRGVLEIIRAGHIAIQYGLRGVAKNNRCGIPITYEIVDIGHAWALHATGLY